MSFLKNIWRNSSKHKKLSEELTLRGSKESVCEATEAAENEKDELVYKMKYLGSTVLEKSIGENISVEAVKKILKEVKSSRKKLQRVKFEVTLKGIIVKDLQDSEMFRISIYRISNCSTDASHRQVFSFISTDEHETMLCHAFLCSKRKMAENVTLAVANAFSTAYEAWRILPEAKQFEKSVTVANENMKNALASLEKEEEKENVEEKLIDFDDDELVNKRMNTNTHWVSFDDDFAPESQRRTNSNDLIL